MDAGPAEGEAHGHDGVRIAGTTGTTEGTGDRAGIAVVLAAGALCLGVAAGAGDADPGSLSARG